LTAPAEPSVALLVLLFAGALWAGAQNALAGGGSFITLPILMLTGLDARAANIASAMALFPSQIAAGWRSRPMADGVGRLSLTTLLLLSLAGGAAGAVVLLMTPVKFFERLIPWLVLFATTAFAWGSFGPKPAQARREHPARTAIIQFLLGGYGGYFGGGNGFLLMAALALAGQGVRTAGATKNVVNVAMNFTAVGIFVLMGQIHWLQVSVAAFGAVIGSFVGVWLLRRLDEKVLRVVIVVIGVVLAVGLFVRGS
jgi:uncharacterized membrane protein YfcA